MCLSLLSIFLFSASSSFVRLIPTTSHDMVDIDETLYAFSKIRSKLYDGAYKKIAEKLKLS